MKEFTVVEIRGKQFSLFWDIDRDKLKTLPFSDRVDWLRQRVESILLKPLEILEKAETQALVWMATTELICAGIESFGGLYGDGRHGASLRHETGFCRFVHTFMHGDFSRKTQSAEGVNWTYCQHLERYFRDGLDHGFSIEWGGLWHSGEGGTQGYLRPTADGKGIAVDPRELLRDFRQAVTAYFNRLEKEGEHSIIGQNFQNRFNHILEHRGRIR